MYIQNYKDLTVGFEQRWKYQPLYYGSVSSDRILELCARGAITKAEVAVMKFLMKVKIAPVELIQACVKEVKEMNANDLTSRLRQLVKFRIMNSCVFTDVPVQIADYDELACEFFCLDYGALTILRSVNNSLLLDEWKAVDCMMTGLQAKRQCMLIELIKRLYEEIPDKVGYVHSHKIYGKKGTRFVPKLEFGILDTSNENDEFKNCYKTYLVEVVTDEDMYQGVESELFNKLTRYGNLLDTSEDEDKWRLYFTESVTIPTVILLSDGLRSASISAKQVADIGIAKSRYCILDDKKDLSKCFYRYNGADLVPVNLLAFAKAEKQATK